ncbi:hypothetical protein [Parendozoicomonas sp. Alg238-R29]|uniref:hypothetical protein n=1 Tax=Parendozoicomonas sp. Alg238-R29 TaxID=2993446 RepID=UPI00248D4B2D|nr:hypothetical protein [Parendozoicomonas sp. Alg238-R29]
MDSVMIQAADNSHHFFPDGSSEKGDQTCGIWPIKGKRFITKIDDVFDTETLKKVTNDITDMRSAPNSKRYTNVVRIPLVGAFSNFPTYNLVTPVTQFGEDGKIANKDNLIEWLKEKKASATVVDFTFSSIEKMASLGGWSNTTVPVAAFFIRYELKTDATQLSNFPWHRDINSLSMTSVITPCHQEHGSFAGGELFFAERTPDYNEYNRHDGGVNTVLSHTIKKFTYPYGGCLFFENLWSQHKVNDIEMVSGHNCERTLFSIFANPNPDQLESFISKNRNLATDAPPPEDRACLIV